MSDARFGPAQHDAILQPAGICQSLLPPLAASASTLDSIQCHSISQCNAHAAAYRRVSSVKRPLFPADASRVKCPTCNRSVHQGFARANMARRWAAFIHGFHFSVTLCRLFMDGSARRRSRFENRCPSTRFNVAFDYLQPLPLISGRERERERERWLASSTL